jgi:polyisoprenoid-binding protein YceI
LRRSGPNRFQVLGDLTIKSVTRPATFEVKYNGVVPAPWGGMRANFSARTRLDRRHFDIPLQSPTPVPGLLVVGNRVWLDLDISLAKR